MLLPSSRLPPIKRIPSTPITELNDSIEHLRVIYNPEVRGSRRRRPAQQTGGPQNKTSNDLDELRTDTFERSYAIKWITALISALSAEEVLPATDTAVPETTLTVEHLLQKAASLLAVCAGTASAGEIVRNFVFETEDHRLLRIYLRDVPMDNQDYGSVGAQTWGGACVLAEMIVEKPENFGLVPSISAHSESGSQKNKLRVLELGAGTGLVSLAAARIVESQATSSSKVEIVSTDYYPSVLENLKANIKSNFPSTHLDTLEISACPLDWSSFSSSQVIPSQLETPFDVAYGADIIYEALHAHWIKSCLETLLRQPTNSEDDPVFHLVIPLRSTHTSESNTIEQVFPKQQDNNSREERSKMELVIKYKEVIICEAETGKDRDEVEYSYYKIGWGFHK